MEAANGFSQKSVPSLPGGWWPCRSAPSDAGVDLLRTGWRLSRLLLFRFGAGYLAHGPFQFLPLLGIQVRQLLPAAKQCPYPGPVTRIRTGIGQLLKRVVDVRRIRLVLAAQTGKGPDRRFGCPVARTEQHGQQRLLTCRPFPPGIDLCRDLG